MFGQVLEVLLQTTEGKEMLKAADPTKHVHLQCAVEYQALHSSNTDSKAVAATVLQHLQPT